MDFITPVVDDPYVYGQIAAANSLSDIFAMGAVPKTVLNLLMWDKQHVDVSEVSEILKGGLDKTLEAKAVLIGGHTIVDMEQKYGLSVTGVVENDVFWKNSTAQIGDVLVLSKPIGTGIITTAMKNDIVSLLQGRECIDSMKMLNSVAMEVALNFEIHACTDITGFGLIGHSLEMCGVQTGKISEKSILLHTADIPIFDRLPDLVEKGSVPGGSRANREYLKAMVQIICDLKEDIYYYDAQTSGGLLFALPKKMSEEFVSKLKLAGCYAACTVGEVIPKKDHIIVLG